MLRVYGCDNHVIYGRQYSSPFSVSYVLSTSSSEMFCEVSWVTDISFKVLLSASWQIMYLSPLMVAQCKNEASLLHFLVQTYGPLAYPPKSPF